MKDSRAILALVAFALALGATLAIGARVNSSPLAPSKPAMSRPDSPAIPAEDEEAGADARISDLRQRIAAADRELASLGVPVGPGSAFFDDAFLLYLARAYIDVNLRTYVKFAEQRFGLDPAQLEGYKARLREYFESHPFAAFGGGWGSQMSAEVLAPFLKSGQFDRYRAWKTENESNRHRVEGSLIAAAARIPAAQAERIHAILTEEGHTRTTDIEQGLTDLVSARAAATTERAALERARVRFGPLLNEAQRRRLDAFLDQNLDRMTLFVEEFENALKR